MKDRAGATSAVTTKTRAMPARATTATTAAATARGRHDAPSGCDNVTTAPAA